MCAVISRGILIFLHLIFYCGLYCRAVYTAEQVTTNNNFETFSIFFILLLALLGNNFQITLFSKMMPNFWQLATTPILKIDNLAYIYWFLAKNPYDFVSLPWKVHNRYCHDVQYFRWKIIYRKGKKRENSDKVLNLSK